MDYDADAPYLFELVDGMWVETFILSPSDPNSQNLGFVMSFGGDDVTGGAIQYSYGPDHGGAA